MYIENFTIQNYKSFADSGVVKLGPGFNVIVGANNAGKTAMLEALSLRFTGQPHRSRITVPHPTYPVEPLSSVRVVFLLESGEVTDLIVEKAQQFAIPTGSNPAGRSADEVLTILQRENKFNGTYTQLTGLQGSLESFANFSGAMGLFYTWHPKQSQFRPDNTVNQTAYNVPLAAALQERIYMFRAERLNFPDFSVAENRVLEPNAANLAQVLHTLQSNHTQFARLNSYVTRIFPDIGWVRVATRTGSSNAYILVEPALTPEDDREDLGVPLSECGTGVGQVLAMLYVVLTSRESHIIIIDEPQSFLHPGAVRKLFEILKTFPRHQYIVTTHAPEVIAAANPTTLTLLRKEGAETVVQQLDVQEAQHMRGVLAVVGARLSDVFGADDILWVEGPTEEQCFPLIVEHMLKRPLMGTKIVGLLHTGDLEGRHANNAIRIYGKLSHGGSLIPPAVGFILDRETRSGQAQKEIAQRIKGAESQIEFLPRRMFENYLLDPRAIAALVSGIVGFFQEPIEEAAVLDKIQEWLAQVPSNPDYFVRGTVTPVQNWQLYVDGAKVLHGLFSELSECRVEYTKTGYGPILTKWIVENDPESLRDIANILDKMLSPSEAEHSRA